MPIGRPIRHRLVIVAVMGLVTAALATGALYRAISISQAQRIERGHEATRDELERLTTLGESGMAPTASPLVGMRGGILAGPDELARLDLATPPAWRAPMHALVAHAAATSAAVSEDHGLDGGQLVARAARLPDRRIAWAAVLVRPSPTLQSWRAVLVALTLSALLLVVSVSYALFSLKRAAGSLRSALNALAEDLNAPVPRSSVRELDDIADGIGTLARHLAEARRIQDRLAKDLARQERLAALGRVVAGVAHEVRNPLASIKLRLDLAGGSNPGLPDGTRAAIAHATTEITRLDRLVADLLIVAGRAPRRLAPVDLGGLVRARVEALGPWASLRRVTVAVHGGGTTMADADGLARAVDNVLRNAVEAAPEATIVEAKVAPEGAGFCIDVADRGGGVPDGRAGEIFEPFFTTKPDGTGLGLAISRAIARAHGGDLTYARDGGLTHLTLTLPMASADSPSALTDSEPARPA